MTQPEQIDCIITKTAEYFGVSRDDLFKSHGNKHMVWRYKKYLVTILVDNFDLSFTHIGRLLNYKTPQNVLYNYKQMKDELSPDFYGSDRVKKTYKLLNEYIGL